MSLVFWFDTKIFLGNDVTVVFFLKLVERIKVKAEGTVKKSWILRDYSNFLSKLLNINFPDVHSVYQYSPLFKFHNT